jgi:ribonuclease E
MECLGRDRTKHQVAEVTSLGLVQMTRKRVGQGLLEAFSETCEHCKGRGIIVHLEPLGDRRGGGNGRKSEPARPAARAAEPEPPAVPVQADAAEEPEDLPEVVDEASGSVPGAMGAEEIEMEAPPVAAAPKRRTRRRVVSRPAGPPAAVPE